MSEERNWASTGAQLPSLFESLQEAYRKRWLADGEVAVRAQALDGARADQRKAEADCMQLTAQILDIVDPYRKAVST